MAKTLSELERILGGLLTRPLADTQKKIDDLSREDKTSPAPHLARALTSAFGRHFDTEEARKSIATAGELLRTIADRDNPEVAFARALHDVMDAEAQITMLFATHEASTRKVVDLEKRSLEGQARMREALKQLTGPGSALASTVSAMLGAMSRAVSPYGERYRDSVAALGKWRRNESVGQLASFFQLYAYRRARNYAAAIRVGQALERVLPRSPVVKRTIASCYHWMGDSDRALTYFKQAVALDPNEPSVRLDYARTLARAGDAAAAEEQIKKARDMGVVRRSPQALRSALQMVNIARVGTHRFAG